MFVLTWKASESILIDGGFALRSWPSKVAEAASGSRPSVLLRPSSRGPRTGLGVNPPRSDVLPNLEGG
jgi:hypothetical protein